MDHKGPYTRRSYKIGIQSSIELLIWGAFIIGIQTYVLVNYTKVFGDTFDGDKNWEDAYNGMALASGAACMIIGVFCLVVIPESSIPAATGALILSVIGLLASLASTVLSALESQRISESAIHPCSPVWSGFPSAGPPQRLECNNWLALEITITALSGIAVFSYLYIIIMLARGINNRSQMPTNNDQSKPYQAYVGPYGAPASSSQLTIGQEPNPQYVKHLERLSSSANPQQPMIPPVNIVRDPNVPQRGKLHALHNQRQRAPPAPIHQMQQPPHSPYSPPNSPPYSPTSTNTGNFNRF